MSAYDRRAGEFFAEVARLAVRAAEGFRAVGAAARAVTARPSRATTDKNPAREGRATTRGLSVSQPSGTPHADGSIGPRRV